MPRTLSVAPTPSGHVELYSHEDGSTDRLTVSQAFDLAEKIRQVAQGIELREAQRAQGKLPLTRASS